MTSKKNKSTELVKVSKSNLIALIASKIKGKTLFPKKIDAGKKLLDRARLIK
jgi:hypothetical protein